MSRMTLSDRIEIEAGIYARKSLSEIAEQIHKSRRYVSEELRRNATKIPGEHPLENAAETPQDADEAVCGGKLPPNVLHLQRSGLPDSMGHTMTILQELQNRPTSAMFAADAKMQVRQRYYTAQQADAVAKRRHPRARNKPQMQKEAMAALDALVTLIKKGSP